MEQNMRIQSMTESFLIARAEKQRRHPDNLGERVPDIQPLRFAANAASGIARGPPHHECCRLRFADSTLGQCLGILLLPAPPGVLDPVPRVCVSFSNLLLLLRFIRP